jgi:hypothetical protein
MTSYFGIREIDETKSIRNPSFSLGHPRKHENSFAGWDEERGGSSCGDSALCEDDCGGGAVGESCETQP